MDRQVGRDVGVISPAVSCGALTDERRRDLNWKDSIPADRGIAMQPGGCLREDGVVGCS